MDALRLRPGGRHELGAQLPDTTARVAVLCTGTVRDWAEDAARSCREAGREVIIHQLGDGESGKRAAEAERAWAVFAGAGLTRSDVVVAVGGGALTDAAGFCAATWLRGIAWIAVPTTTLGMIDAAHGGKVALNTPAGKNLVGAFHPASAVVLDPEVLSTLPVRDLRAGLVEAVKCAWLAGATLPCLTGELTEPVLAQLLALGGGYKNELVARDPYEHGDRVLLNYGHTLGHAVEAESGFALRHGEAVGIGMVYAAEVAERAGLAEPGLAGRHRAVLRDLGVPVTWTGEWEQLEPYLAADKKNRGARRRWVLLEREGLPVVADQPEPAVLRAALRALAD